MTSPRTKRGPVEKYSIGRKTCLLLLYGPEILCFTGIKVSFRVVAIAGSLNLRERRTYISVEVGYKYLFAGLWLSDGRLCKREFGEGVDQGTEMYRNYLTDYSDALFEREFGAFDLRFASRKDSSVVESKNAGGNHFKYPPGIL